MQYNEFVLYCHISSKGETINDLKKISDGIIKLLDEQKGILILFIDEGLHDLLRMIHPIQRDLNRDEAKQKKERLKRELLSRSSSLVKGENIGKDLEKHLNKGLAKTGNPKVRVVTSLDLVDIFGEMSAVENLRKFLIGIDGQIHYDTPKFIEAIVRLRMIGSRVPVFRLDQDVLIPPGNEVFNKNELALAIRMMCDGVTEHHEKTQVLSTILSANYKVPDESTIEDVRSWNRGYATRINPILLIPDDKVAQEYISNSTKITDWRLELKKHFDQFLAKKFYKNIWEWGAPTTAIISGALLYMNDAVVLNVPPFSNFSQKVMWIDDHLRYVLHREMGDFCKSTQIGLKSEKPLNVQYSEDVVTKYRTEGNFLIYTIKDYLPSLLWGSFIDYWLCAESILKRRKDELSEKKKVIFDDLRIKGCPGILATAIREARAGCLPDEALLRKNLIDAANIRLKKIIQVWRNLKIGDSISIASAWVEGKLPPSVINELQNSKKKDQPKIPIKLQNKVEKFEGGLRDGFNILLDDTCRYVKWVFEWPHIVSVIRSIPPGEFKSDLEWKP